MMRATELDRLLDNSILPEGGENIFFLRDKAGNLVSYAMNHPNVTYLGQQMSKKVFSNTRIERYVPLTVGTSLNSMKTNRELRKVAGDYYIWNGELLLKSGFIVTEPRVEISDDEKLKYKDFVIPLGEHDIKPMSVYKNVKADIDLKNIVRTLVKADIIDEPEELPIEASIPFQDNGLLGIRSRWNKEKNMPELTLSSALYADGQPVFEKITSKNAKAKAAC